MSRTNLSKVFTIFLYMQLKAQKQRSLIAYPQVVSTMLSRQSQLYKDMTSVNLDANCLYLTDSLAKS